VFPIHSLSDEPLWHIHLLESIVERASAHNVERDLAWLDDDTLIRDALFLEVPPKILVFAREILDCPHACRVLSYLSRRPQMVMTVTDLAYMTGAPEDGLPAAFHVLAEHGVIRCQEIAGVAFYGLTLDPTALAKVEAFYAWRRIWTGRLRRLQNALQFAP
jgi:hypothetical protein